MASGVVKHGWATDDIIMEAITSNTITIGSGSTGHCTANCNKSGYTPIGVVGVSKYTNISGGQNTSQSMIYEYDVQYNSTNSRWEAYVYFRNFASAEAKFYCKIYILYKKND